MEAAGEDVGSYNQIWDIALKDLEFREKIGQGGFGQVYEGRYLGLNVAIKSIDKINDPKYFKYIEREVLLLRGLRHPCIVPFVGVCSGEQYFYVVTEFIQGGDLRKLIKRSKDLPSGFPWRTRFTIAQNIASVMLFLHSKGILHRDLKSQNILIERDGERCYLCDFGFARIKEERKDMRLKRSMTFCGTRGWVAPELLLGRAYDATADVYSFGLSPPLTPGIVLAELITLRKPGKEFFVRDATKGIVNVDAAELAPLMPADTPAGALDLIRRCVAPEALQRPDFRQVLANIDIIIGTLPKPKSVYEIIAEQKRKPSVSVPVTPERPLSASSPIDDIFRAFATPTVVSCSLFKTGVRIGKNKFAGKTFDDCFVGKEGLEWMIAHVAPEKKAAKKLCGQLLKQKYISHVSTNLLGYNNKCFFRFTDIARALMRANPAVADPNIQNEAPVVIELQAEDKQTLDKFTDATDICLNCIALDAQEDAQQEVVLPELVPSMLPIESQPVDASEGEGEAEDVLAALRPLVSSTSPQTLTTLSSSVVPAESMFKSERIVLTMLRHFGCVFCRKGAALLAEISDELIASGVTLVAVGTGSPAMAHAFIQETGFKGDLYVDPGRKLYAALDCRRGLKYVINGKTLAAAKMAREEGHSPGKKAGDTLQLGGTFILSRREGVLFEHLEAVLPVSLQYAGDLVNPQRVLEALKGLTIIQDEQNQDF